MSVVDKKGIVRTLEDLGVHVVAALPTSDGHGFGLSPFELFLLKQDRIVLRESLSNCRLFVIHEANNTIRLRLVLPESGRCYETSCDADWISTNGEEDDASKFAEAVNFPGFFEDWRYLWEDLILTEFEFCVREWHLWQQISSWGQHQENVTTNFLPADSVSKHLGRSVGKSLFASLDDFLLQPDEDSKQVMNFWRNNEWNDGAMPSLKSLTEKLQSICTSSQTETGFQPPDTWENCAVFSDDQIKELKNIETDLKKYDPYIFWSQAQQDYLQNSAEGESKLDFVLRKIDEQKMANDNQEQVLATYIRTARNAMANNRHPMGIEQYYILRAGYCVGLHENLITQAIDRCFDFLRRLHTNVFGFDPRQLEDWQKSLYSSSASDAEELRCLLENRLETVPWQPAARIL